MCNKLTILTGALALVGTAVSAQDDIETIRVTSQRIIKPAYDVASNIQVFNKQDIDALNVDTLSELVSLIPNFNMQSITGDYSYIQVRGMPRNFEQSTLSVFIDGVPHSSLYGLNLPLYDIHSIEVIKGPQGNLYGRNSRDGVIVINTKKPADNTEINAAISKGQQGLSSGHVVASTELLPESLHVKAGVELFKQDGSVFNPLLGVDVDPRDERNAFVKLYWQQDNLSADLLYSQSKKDNGLAPYVDVTTVVKDGDKLEIELNEANLFTQKIAQTALHINYQTQAFSVHSITSVNNTDTDAEFDADYSSLPYGNYLTRIDEKDFYQEFRASIDDKKMQWLFGLSFNKNKQDNNNNYPLLATQALAKIERKNQLAYVDVNWQPTDKINLQLGTRYFDEEVTAKTQYINPAIPMPDINTYGEVTQSDNRFLSKAAAHYRLDENQNLYVSFGEGYLSAGTSWLGEEIDMTTASRLGTGTNYGAELSRNLELGYKGDFSDINSQLEISVFNTEISDYQHFHLSPFGINQVTTVESVISQGVEVMWASQLSQQLQWQLSAGKRNAHIDKIGGQPDPGLNISVNDKVPFTPNHSVTNTINYSTLVANNWQVDLNLTWLHVGEQQFDFDGLHAQASYNQFDANLMVKFNANWQAQLWAKNLTDKRAQQFMITMPGAQLANYIQQKQIGLTISYTL